MNRSTLKDNASGKQKTPSQTTLASNKMENKKDLSIFMLRIALSLVFFYFGFQQISNSDVWTGFIPQFVQRFFPNANNIVVFNGILELTFGTFLMLGLYTRFTSLILSAHLILISLSIGLSPIGVRDFGLAFATLVPFLYGPDKYTLDTKIKNKVEKHVLTSSENGIKQVLKLC